MCLFDLFEMYIIGRFVYNKEKVNFCASKTLQKSFGVLSINQEMIRIGVYDGGKIHVDLLPQYYQTISYKSLWPSLMQHNFTVCLGTTLFNIIPSLNLVTSKNLNHPYLQ